MGRDAGTVALRGTARHGSAAVPRHAVLRRAVLVLVPCHVARLAHYIGDRAKDPGFDDAIHARPIRIDGNRFVEADVVLEGEFSNGEEELVTPTSVVAGGDVEDDGDQAPDVLHRHSLRMEADNGGSLV